MRPRARTLLTGIVATAICIGVLPAQAGAQAGVSYSVPGDNPFAGEGVPGADEIWAYGLRNPWRFSFDAATGDLIIADVGQGDFEEIDFAPAGTGAGANYGWNCFEGSAPFAGAPPDCAAPGHVPPVLEYSSADPVNCAVTGGYVVRDPRLGALQGRYLFGDFCGSFLRTAVLSESGATSEQTLLVPVPLVSSFGEDSERRLYALSLLGPVFRLEPGAGPLSPLPVPIGVFLMPTYLTSEPDDADRLYVVQQGGKVKLVAPPLNLPRTFLDVSDRVSTSDQERGLLSIAFPPDYAESGLFYISYTTLSGDVRIEEYRRSPADPNRADPGSGRLVLEVEHRTFGNHNGGQLQFGPDGYLYASFGDGGGAGDPLGNGQDKDTLLGSIIRIDPSQPTVTP